MSIGIEESLNHLIRAAVEEAVERRLPLLTPAISQPWSPAPQSLPVTLDVAELAEFLRLGTPDANGRRPGGIRTIRQWIAEGRVPHRRANGRIIFLAAEILAWTATNPENERRKASTRTRKVEG